MQTYNCGVCIRVDDDDGENHYYGVLKEIYEYSFTNHAEKKLLLFKCDWYDPGPYGTKTNRQFRLVEINEKRKYPHYDPFIFAHFGWKSVIKITPHNVVENQ